MTKDQEIHKTDSQTDQVEILKKGLLAVADLINASYGVSGLHLNGDEAPWDDLRTGGRFEDWLYDFDEAINLIEEGKVKMGL